MLLQKFVEYEKRGNGVEVPLGYNAQTVDYWIELDGEGTFLGVVPAAVAPGERPKQVPMPAISRANAVKPKLLTDNAAYVLAVPRETDKPERVIKMHRAYVELVQKAARETGEPALAAVERFLSNMRVEAMGLPSDFVPEGTMAFTVAGVRPTDLPSVQQFWARYTTPGQVMQCLVCGHTLPVMDRLQLKLKGIPGGQPSGLALISANSPAFESYGLEASTVAPTCQTCSDAFMKGANLLIHGEGTHLRVGNTVYVFWNRDEVEFDVLGFLSRPDPDDVARLLKQVYGGGKAFLDVTPFYAACLTASGSRAVVRDWIDSTLGEVKTRLALFFEMQSIVGPWGEQQEGLGVYQLSKATLPSGADPPDPAPWVVRSLVHFALSGGPLPFTLLQQAVARCRAEEGVNRARAALIKLVLCSQGRVEGTGGRILAELDMENRDPAYLCGRLFAELEATQRAALGDVGATIVDRYYGTASSAPATVFGRLVRGAQPHLGKLRRDKPGAYNAIQARLEEILADLNIFPSTLKLEQQGVFALGYYHQRAVDRAARSRHRETPAQADEDVAEEEN